MLSTVGELRDGLLELYSANDGSKRILRPLCLDLDLCMVPHSPKIVRGGPNRTELSVTQSTLEF